MKKLIAFLICIVSLFSTVAFADVEITATVNGEKLIFDVPPTIVDNRTMVPIRAVCEALGADVYWHGETKSIIIVKNDTKLYLAIDHPYLESMNCVDFADLVAQVEADQTFEWLTLTELDAPPMIKDNRTLLPIRAVCEALGATVTWEQEAMNVKIECSEELIAAKNVDTEFFDLFVNYLYGNKEQYDVITEQEESQTTESEGLSDNEEQLRNTLGTVYRTPSGTKYHIDPECGGKNSYEITLQEAENVGLTPCKKCV